MATRHQCLKESAWTLAQAASCSWRGRGLRQQAGRRLCWWLEDWESAWGTKVRCGLDWRTMLCYATLLDALSLLVHCLLGRHGCPRGRFVLACKLKCRGSNGHCTRRRLRLLTQRNAVCCRLQGCAAVKLCLCPLSPGSCALCHHFATSLVDARISISTNSIDTCMSIARLVHYHLTSVI
jgi:hypothetical protein